jgi:hypothetical protein
VTVFSGPFCANRGWRAAGVAFHASEDSQFQGHKAQVLRKAVRFVDGSTSPSGKQTGLRLARERPGVFSICGPICCRHARFCWTAASPQQRVTGFVRSDFFHETVSAVFSADDLFLQAVARCRLTVFHLFLVTRGLAPDKPLIALSVPSTERIFKFKLRLSVTGPLKMIFQFRSAGGDGLRPGSCQTFDVLHFSSLIGIAILIVVFVWMPSCIDRDSAGLDLAFVLKLTECCVLARLSASLSCWSLTIGVRDPLFDSSAH